MRIVQTFWSAKRDPLHSHFGWLHPEYNLMSWTLSCHCLRKHYDEVALYTDTAGKQLLIDTLHLPYTEVNVVYDDLACLPQHWALAKIKTYSLQTKPFLHVDGDVFLPQPLSEPLLSADLIAQNEEYATEFYKKMVREMLAFPNLQLPKMLRDGLERDDFESYNMGLFGGNDLDFIHRYCQVVFDFYQQNNPDERIRNCNVISEQIFFGILAHAEDKTVEGFFQEKLRDNGYTRTDVCDLRFFNKKPYFHVLGGHKGRKEVCCWLEYTLIRLYPQAAETIFRLFPERHEILAEENRNKPTFSELISIAQQQAASLTYCVESAFDGNPCLHRHPYIEELECTDNRNNRYKIPSIGASKYEEHSANDLGDNILSILEQPLPYKDLCAALTPCFTGKLSNDTEQQEKMIREELVYLIQEGLVFVSPIKDEQQTISNI